MVIDLYDELEITKVNAVWDVFRKTTKNNELGDNVFEVIRNNFTSMAFKNFEIWELNGSWIKLYRPKEANMITGKPLCVDFCLAVTKIEVYDKDIEERDN